jgi:hypothetical protein
MDGAAKSSPIIKANKIKILEIDKDNNLNL